MNDLHSEIREAFQKEQAQNPPAAHLRQTVTQAVAERPRHRPNVQWMAVAATILLAALVVAGLMSARLANRSSVPAHPKAVATPSPAGDYGPPPAGVPLFYVRDPNHSRWYVGFDWSGAPRGTLKLAQPLDQMNTLLQAPDGSAFQVTIGAKGGGETLLDRLGNAISGTGGTWADDNIHTCSLFFDQQKFTWTVETGGIGQGVRPIALIATDSGVGQTGISLAACSFKNDRAIAVRTSVSWVSEVWVIRISDGQVLSHHTYQDGKVATIVASSDAAYIAENTWDTTHMGAAQTPGVTIVRRVSDWTQVATEGQSAVRAFSGDDSLVLTTPNLLAEIPGISVVQVATGKVIWQYAGNSGMAGFFTQPTGPAFAIMLQQLTDQTQHPQVTVVMVFLDGNSVGLPGPLVRP